MAKVPPALLSRNVIVTTPVKIGGQNEHAAVITKVIEDELVNVMLFPSDGSPYPISSIYHANSAKPGAITWRWPSRT